MRSWQSVVLWVTLMLVSLPILARQKTAAKPLQCVAFSPYLAGLTPDYGMSPSAALIDTLLDRLVNETPFRCLMTYGVTNGLDYVFKAAEARHIRVIAILWIDQDKEINSQSIAVGIHLARTYPNTLIKLSCGSEVRTRHDYRYDDEVQCCLLALREAKVTQPITTIDTWWEWFNRSQPCQATRFSSEVDWIGINVFPWWENRYSSLHSCTTAKQAANFHLARIQEVQRANPGKEIILTEFGWPHGPSNAINDNVKTRQRCGIANAANQSRVIKSTFKKLGRHGQSAVVFEAFSEHWKPSNEGDVGSFWGICEGEPPYHCDKRLLPD